MIVSSYNNWFPLISLKVAPKSKDDWDKLKEAFATIAGHDPDAHGSFNSQDGDAILGGKSEVHLKGILGSLISQGVVLSVGAPQVCYRETITRSANVDVTHKKQSGGVGQFARVIFRVEPRHYGAGVSFENKITEGSIPATYFPGIERGVASVLETGAVAGFPIVDIGIILVDGSYHEQDSSMIAFEIATRSALRQALDGAGSVLLEPIMKVDITVPKTYVGNVICDLNDRRGMIVGTASLDEAIRIAANVSLVHMFRYANTLKLLTWGEGTFTMEYSHHQAVHRANDDDSGPDNFPPSIGMRV